MSDPLRTDASRAPFEASDGGRDAKIEQLLLAGLDDYFAGEYDEAIHIWTRVLFLDRSHARARAYIERARSALAERQRESEELLQNGAAAFGRGDSHEARRLLTAALESGAPHDEALAILNRLDRLNRPAERVHGDRFTGGAGADRSTRPRRSLVTLGLAAVGGLTLAAAAVYVVSAFGPADWRSWVLRQPQAPAGRAATAVHGASLTLPTRGEMALTRARALASEGRLRDALDQLDLVRVTDTQRLEADRLRGDIQRQLIALASAPHVSAAPPLDGRRP